jgi:hypothetical protein
MNQISPSDDFVLRLDFPNYIEVKIGKRVFLRDEVVSFNKIIDQALAEGQTRFLINFENCQYISSEGLGAVARFWRVCSESEKLKMVSLFHSDPVNELLEFFEIIGLIKVMDGHTFKDSEAARAFLTK